MHALIEKAMDDNWSVVELVEVAETVGFAVTLDAQAFPAPPAQADEEPEDDWDFGDGPDLEVRRFNRERRRWSADELEAARLWWRSGKSQEEIAWLLGRSSEAVRKKIAMFRNEK